jgi:selenocysteine lyase/cysteine desulfurase
LIDVTAARHAAPGANASTYLDYAGGGPPPSVVSDAVVSWVRHEATVGPAVAARHADLEPFYEGAARFLGASADEIAYVNGAARGWQAVLLSFQWRRGDRVLTCRSRGASESIALIRAAQRHGVSVEAIPSGADGRVSLAALEAMLDERVRLVAVSHAAAHRGLLEPVVAIGAMLRARGVPMLVDASLSVGQIPVHVHEIGCDFLVASCARFLRGPTGSGLLYVRRTELGHLDWPVVDARGAAWVAADGYVVRKDARRLESSERSLASVFGLAAAIAYATSLGLSETAVHLESVAARLRARLAALPGVQTWDAAPPTGAIVTFTVKGKPAAAIRDALAPHGVQVAAIPAADARLDLIPRGLADGVVRASVHVTTTDDDLDQLTERVAALA